MRMGPTILSRTRELDAIARFLDAIPEAPSALVLAGPAGIGKTTLWEDGVDDAAQRGYRVLRARPTEAEARLSYAALTDLVGASFDETRAALPPVQARALAAALLREPTDEASEGRLVATAFTGVLARLAADGPLVVAIDDAQWLDGASRRVLEFAARRLEGPTGMLTTVRTDDAGDAPLGLRRAFPEERFALLVVGPLSMGALHHLMRERLDVSPPRPVLARIATASGGNPYFALELARTVADDDAESTLADPLRVPRTLQELVADHLNSLSDAGREAALVAASLSSPTDELVVTAGVSAAALAEVEQAGVLIRERGRLRFAHPLLASVVYASAADEPRRLVHRRLAEIVVDDEERARHLAQSTSVADATAANAIELGARRAAQRGAQDEASELYAAARRLTPGDRPNDAARRLLGGAAASNAVGEFATARALAESALDEASDGELRAEILTFLARLAWFSGNADQAAALVERALHEVADDEARGAILARLAQFNFAYDFERAVEYSDAALASLREDRDPVLVAHALIYRFFGGAMRGLGARRELLERGLELEARALPRLPDGPASRPLIWFHCVDEFDAARARHAFEDEWYRERGEEVWVADRLSHLAAAELRAGRWELAERQTEASCTMLDPLEIGGPRAMVFEKRALVDAHVGRVDRARATLSPLVERFEASGQRWWAANSLSTLGFAEFAAGDAAAADEAWRRMHVHAEAVGAREILADRSEPFHVEALLALGDVDGARNVLERLEQRGRVLPRIWIDIALPRARALVVAADGDLPAALTLLADVELDPGVVPFELACNLLVKGRLARRAKRKLIAAEALRAALALFEQLGAPAWIERTKEELDRVGLRRRAPDELTAGERKVAELAATGMTNRQVAEAAFMSPKTVEANLARVYRKLGIGSRAELGARLALEEREAGAQT